MTEKENPNSKKTEHNEIKGNHNRLSREKSPYLLQHAKNPVDWYPWGEEAFAKARDENKPIFLSIGYSTCHWCHVMERESFEDQEVAALMNEVVVSIKVDREERPDIDNVYMTVCQMMTGGGGWPLTIIMTPDKKPFYAATYIPKHSVPGRAGMMDLISHIRELWAEEKEKLTMNAQKVAEALQAASILSPEGELGGRDLAKAYDMFAARFDPVHGGFGTAPKFPTPHNLIFLLRHWDRTGDKKALDMVEKTLAAMRQGGIYDHIGFGFHRYSTDREWLVPHFEKMLYDQALLAAAFIEAWLATGKPEYEKTTKEIFEYVLRDMTSPAGAFYSAEDADSEGVEGKFYVWAEKEIRETLAEPEADIFIKAYNIVAAGNFAEEATKEITGANILHLTRSLSETASDLNMSEKELRELLEKAIKKLFDVREKRVHPCRDDKVLADWNGLMISALARGARAFDEPEYARAAERAAGFVLENMRDNQGRLLHRFRDNEAAVSGNADDYAFFIQGLLDLYEATFDVGHLKTAMELNEDFIERFWDKNSGGFYFIADDAENLLVRAKEIYDGAVPSGNSVAALNLMRLSRITANADLEKKAREIGRIFSSTIKQAPMAFAQMLAAVDFAAGPSYEVVIAGNTGTDDTREMIKALNKHYSPNKVVIFRPAEIDSPEIADLAEYTLHQKPESKKATAFVCVDFHCNRPTTDPQQMLGMLKGNPGT